MSFVDDLLPSLDAIRGIPGELGLRPYTVTLQVTTWSGARPGLGTATTTSTPLYVGGGTQNPKVTQLSGKDVVASGGVYTSQDLRVGPFTPNAVPAATLDPSVVSAGEVRFLLTGPGLPAAGAVYERIGHEVDRATRTFVILRKTGEAP